MCVPIRTKFHIRSTNSAIPKFRDNILESSRNVSETKTTPDTTAGYGGGMAFQVR